MESFGKKVILEDCPPSSWKINNSLISEGVEVVGELLPRLGSLKF